MSQRLSPIAPDRLDEKQKPVFEEMMKQTQAPGFDTFVTQGEDGALLGPWNVWLHTPDVGHAITALADSISKMKGLPKRVKQIAILTVGAHFNAAYELYAHSAIARADGFDDNLIAELVENREPSITGDERLAYDATKALLKGGVMPDPLYQGIWKAFGQEGCAQLVYLVGQYCFVSVSLNAYAQPVPVLRLNS